MIFFKNGEVVHAKCENMDGVEAFHRILGFHGGTLQNIKGVVPPVVSIETKLESLLFEAAAKVDEGHSHPRTSKTISSTSILTDENDSYDEPEMLGVAIEEQAQNKNSQETNATNDPLLNEDPTMTNIQKILAEFTNIEGVHSACLVGRDGFLLDSIARKGIDAEMIGAIASSGFGSAESMGGQLGQGDLTMTMIEYNNGPVMFAPVGTEAFLVIVADKETNLGWIRIAIKKNSKEIQRVASL
jgi:hypothetical protein